MHCNYALEKKNLEYNTQVGSLHSPTDNIDSSEVLLDIQSGYGSKSVATFCEIVQFLSRSTE